MRGMSLAFGFLRPFTSQEAYKYHLEQVLLLKKKSLFFLMFLYPVTYSTS